MDASLKRKAGIAIAAAVIAAALLLWLFWPLSFSARYGVGNGVSVFYTRLSVEDGDIANENYEAVLTPGSPELEKLGERLGEVKFHRTLLTPFRQAHWDLEGERQLQIIVDRRGGGTAGIVLTDGGQLYIDGRKYDMGLFSAEKERELLESVIDGLTWSPAA